MLAIPKSALAPVEATPPHGANAHDCTCVPASSHFLTMSQRCLNRTNHHVAIAAAAGLPPTLPTLLLTIVLKSAMSLVRKMVVMYVALMPGDLRDAIVRRCQFFSVVAALVVA